MSPVTSTLVSVAELASSFSFTSRGAPPGLSALVLSVIFIVRYIELFFGMLSVGESNLTSMLELTGVVTVHVLTPSVTVSLSMAL
ncbi:MAG: hypothetical protein ACD_59C00125G0002 [uncultured bacterium]|nr:MAG: hypothetical protein ACD_59C00125G0002 [uncultured bacterium]